MTTYLKKANILGMFLKKGATMDYQPHIWASLAIFALILELMTGTLFVLVVAVAAAVCALMALVGIDFKYQLVVFSSICLITWGFLYKRHKEAKNYSGYEIDKNKAATVIELKNEHELLVAYQGSQWTAKPETGTASGFKPGQQVLVLNVEGITLKVAPLPESRI